MTDEQEEIEVSLSGLTEVYEFSGAGTNSSGQMIFPMGAEVFCKQVGAIALRILDRSGDVEVLTDPNHPWASVGAARGNLKIVK